jgi:catabolite regulation protein CreA
MQMRRYSLLQTMAVVLLLGFSIGMYSVPAEPTAESNVEATITCSFITGAQLTVRAQMIVRSINVFDTVYDREAIENMATTNPYIMGAIMLRLHESLKKQVESAFTNAKIDTMSTTPSYEKPYFIDVFNVNLTPAFFRYNGPLNLTNFIIGVLDIGATVTYHFNLHAEEGWNTTFVYALPSTMMLAYANTPDTNTDTNTVTWLVQNWNGNDPGKEATLSVQSKNPTTKSSETNDIALEYTLDTRTVNNVSFIDSVIVKKVNVRSYNILPEFVTGLASIPADGVRLCIDKGLFSWGDLFENTIQPIEQQTTALIENSSFHQNLNLSFSWDAESTTNCSTPYNITHMDDIPAIRANFKDPDVDLKICQIPSRAFFGLINAGATASISPVDVNFGLGLDGITYPYAMMLRLPTNISLNGDNVYTWNKTIPISGTFSSDLHPVPPYTAEHIETRIEIELLKMDLNIPSIFTGKTELTASTKMKEDDQLYVIRRAGDLSFSPKINITYLNADAFRLCTEENVFSDNQINAFLSQKTEIFQQRLSEIFHGLQVKGITDKTLFSSSLVWDGDISAMDDVVPVVVSNYANEGYTVGFNMSLWPAELTIVPQQFTLQGMENQTVTYRVIFPRGITVNTSNSAGKPLITGKTNDGRDYVELSFDIGLAAQTTVLTCVLNASPVYILGLFLPCLLVFMLLVVLAVIIYLIRKKKGGLRRGKGKLFEPEDNEPEEYGKQEYYVPPPPPSTKKKK